MSVQQQFEVNVTRWIQFVKSNDFIQHVPAKKATAEIVSALKLFQELFPVSKQEAAAALFIAEMEDAAFAMWTDKLQILPFVLGNTCAETVVQWSSKCLPAFISDVFKEKRASSHLMQNRRSLSTSLHQQRMLEMNRFKQN